VAESWALKGEMTLSCSCTVCCPCVLSLGEHPPTADRCQTRAGVRNVVIRNSQYWIDPDVIADKADKSRFRGFGRNWNLAGRSAETVKLDRGNA
jgi:hypothetical protein